MTQIALIAGNYRPESCGVADYTAHLRQQLANRGIQSIVLTTHDVAETTADPTVYGVIKRWHLDSLLPLVQAIHATKADLLHIQHAAGTYGFNRAIFLLPLLLKLTQYQSPIVTTIHEYGWWEWHPKGIPPTWIERLKTWGQRQGWWDREDGFLLTQSDALITTNAGAETVIHARLPALKAPVYRIPIGANITVSPIDRQLARQQLRQRCGWSNEAQIIAFFGFLHPVKGLETLLPAFQQVIKNQSNARLLLIGGVESLALPDQQADRYWQQLCHLIDDLKLDTFVYMTGYLDANCVSEYLSGVDIGVLPFNHGVTLKSGSLLAMLAHALPVVATRSTPPDFDLEQQSWLRLVPPRQVSALATVLDQLLADSWLQQQLGTAGYQFSQQFDWENITNAHLDIYTSVLKSAPRTALKSVSDLYL